MGKKTKKDLVSAIHENLHCDMKDISAIVDAFLHEVCESLMEGNSIELRGFGVFEIKRKKGRSGARNPKTGSPVNVESHSVAVFRPGAKLKENVWKL